MPASPSVKPNTPAVAGLLREYAQRLDLDGDDPHRARAYSRAAENLLLSMEPVDQLIAEGRLKEIPGIGNGIAAAITQIHELGHLPNLTAKRAEAPPGVLEMLQLPGLRPDRVRKLYKELGIASVAELEEAALTGQLASTKGFGPAFQRKVLQSVEMSRKQHGRHLHRAAAAVRTAADALARAHPDWTQVTAAGEFRRGCELVGALSLVAVDARLIGQDRKLEQGDQLIVHVTRPERYGVALLNATGSAEHLAALRSIAKRKGVAWQADGVVNEGGAIAGRTEEDIYTSLGLPFIAPELRETGREVQLALRGKLPKLVTQDDLHGVLHAHTRSNQTAPTRLRIWLWPAVRAATPTWA